MPGRAFFAGNAYRYGFNGKEESNEIAEGDLDFGARIYDVRLARFLSVDPLTKKLAPFSTYCFAINSPLSAIDVDGKGPGDPPFGNPSGWMGYQEMEWRPNKTGTPGTVYRILDNLGVGHFILLQTYTVMSTDMWGYKKSELETKYFYWSEPYDSHINDNPNRDWIPYDIYKTKSAQGSRNVGNGIGVGTFGCLATISAGIFVGGGAPLASSAISALETGATNAALKAYDAYVKWAPAIGIFGNKTAEFLDETGGLSTSGCNKIISNVDNFILSNTKRLYQKLGAKIGLGELPYSKSKQGVLDAIESVKSTLLNPSEISAVIPKETLRGNFDLIHVFSSKTGNTVSLRVLGNNNYEFDTLISGKSGKF